MFASFVPASYDKDEARTDAAFEEALQSTESDQLLEVFGCVTLAMLINRMPLRQGVKYGTYGE